MLTRKAKYALKAMLFLAERENKSAMLISEIAVKEHIPKKFLESILVELKRNGLLDSRSGKGGGYRLRLPASQIFAGEIVRIMEGPLAAVPCVSKTAYRKCDECIDDKTCEIRQVMQQVRDATSAILDGTSLAQMLAKKRGKSNRQVTYEKSRIVKSVERRAR